MDNLLITRKLTHVDVGSTDSFGTAVVGAGGGGGGGL